MADDRVLSVETGVYVEIIELYALYTPARLRGVACLLYPRHGRGCAPRDGATLIAFEDNRV